MGILERFRPSAEEAWRPPALGVCRCETHIEDLLEVEIPRVDGVDAVQVATLVTSGALATVPSLDRMYLPGLAVNERRGPFHWRVVHQRKLDGLFSPYSVPSLDDALFIQPHVDRVLWLADRTELAIGAPDLCIRGIQATVVRALMNPRIRGTQGLGYTGS